LSADMRRRHVLRSRTRGRSEVRMARHVRDVVRFARMNLLCDAPPFNGQADIVFCRNVLIYFDRSTQYRVLSRLAAFVRPGGYLFVGHSEMLHGLDLPFQLCAPTVHRRT
jgi:chemotaxis protein methyltransferase CheR